MRGIEEHTQAGRQRARTSGAVVFMSSRPDTAAPNARGVRSTQRVSMSGALPVCLEGWLRVARCARLSAPAVTVQAALVLESVEARVTLRDRPGRSPRADADVLTMPLVPSGRRIAHPELAVHGLTDGCPMEMQLVDSDGVRLAPDRGVGQCRDGVRELFVPFALRMSVTVWVEVRDWPAGGGPRLSVSGELVLDQGVTARIVCAASPNAARPDASGASDLPLLLPGLAFYSPERSIEGRHPEATWVSVSFHDGIGRPSGDERVLGRCVRI
jgi:hypothetical protein